jgi:hypothetical protein
MPRTSKPAALGLCVVNWFLPGVGYIAVGDTKRGIALFVAMNGCFLIGLLLGGYVLPPEWSTSSPNFSIVSCLTFIMQFFHGIGWAAASVCWNLVQEGSQSGVVHFLAGNPGATNSDFGSFHLLVAGGLNYFATSRLYDLLAGDPTNGEETPAIVGQPVAVSTADSDKVEGSS